MGSTGIHPQEAFPHVKSARKFSSIGVYLKFENHVLYQNADGPSVCLDHGNPRNASPSMALGDS